MTGLIEYLAKHRDCPAISALQIAAIAVLAALACLDIYFRSSALLYSADEMTNLDVVLNFYAHADYTTRLFGSVPFDPSMSSGIAAMWLPGAVLSLGGSLFLARLLTALLQLAMAVVVIVVFTRSRGLRLIESLLVAFVFWSSLLLVGAHEQRIAGPGEVWGALYLALGALFLARSPRLACLCWGIAVWLCKVIYFPFAAALLLATLWVQWSATGGGRSLAGLVRTAAGPVSMFALPLAAWMLLIWARHDGPTLVAWGFSFLAFITKHSTGTAPDLAPALLLPGWRFDPHWGRAAFFTDLESSASLLIPLSFGPLAALRLALCRSRSTAPENAREAAYLVAIAIALAAFCLWFFAFDPTRWPRHLLPAIYVSTAVGLYCVVELRSVARASTPVRVVAAAAVVALVTIAGLRTLGYAQQQWWKGSYARACRGVDVLAPPCKLDEGRRAIAERSNRWCGLSLDGNDFDEHCLRTMRARFLEDSARTMRDPDAPASDVYNAGYVVLHVQQWAYGSKDEFAGDFGSAFCGELSDAARRYVKETGLARSLRGCADEIGGARGGG